VGNEHEHDEPVVGSLGALGIAVLGLGIHCLTRREDDLVRCRHLPRVRVRIHHPVNWLTMRTFLVR
jgi:hypothetical protein